MKLNKLFFITAIAGIISCLSSCKEAVKYVNDIDNSVRIADQAPTSQTVSCKYPPIVVGMDTLYSKWKEGDAILLTNMNVGKSYKFLASAEGSEINFNGEALLSSGDKFTAFYPYRDSTTVDDIYTISIPNMIEQGTPTPENLDKTNYMFASAFVGKDRTLNLNFKRLVSFLNINIHNTSANTSFVLDSIVLKSSEAVFPVSCKIDNNGNIISFSEDKVDNIVIDLKGQTLNSNDMINIASNLLPTTNGSMSIISGSEDVSLVLKTKLNDKPYDFSIYRGNIANLPLSGFSDSNSNLLAGRSYSLSYDVFYERVPSSGYRVEEVNSAKLVTIYNSKGLKNFANALNDDSADDALKAANVVFDSDVTELDMQGIDWMPIKEFNGTLDAKGVVIKNLNISKDGDNAAFIVNSKATISNLIIKNATTELADNSSVLINNMRDGELNNCVVDGATINGNTGFISGLVGNLSGGIISNSYITGDVTISAEDARTGAGGLVAAVSNNAIVKGCYTDTSVSIDVKNVSRSGVGGLVGSLGSSNKLVACYSKASIHVASGAGYIGGLVGQAIGQAKDITGCYAASMIRLDARVSGSAVGGLLGSRWSGGPWNMYKGVYSTTTIIPGNGNAVGAVQGKALGKKDNVQTAISTFYTQDIDPVGFHHISGITKVTVDELKTKIDELNIQLTDTEYQFTTDDGTDTEPLKLVKK